MTTGAPVDQLHVGQQVQVSVEPTVLSGRVIHIDKKQAVAHIHFGGPLVQTLMTFGGIPRSELRPWQPLETQTTRVLHRFYQSHRWPDSSRVRRILLSVFTQYGATDFGACVFMLEDCRKITLLGVDYGPFVFETEAVDSISYLCNMCLKAVGTKFCMLLCDSPKMTTQLSTQFMWDVANMCTLPEPQQALDCFEEAVWSENLHKLPLLYTIAPRSQRTAAEALHTQLRAYPREPRKRCTRHSQQGLAEAFLWGQWFLTTQQKQYPGKYIESDSEGSSDEDTTDTEMVPQTRPQETQPIDTQEQTELTPSQETVELVHVSQRTRQMKRKECSTRLWQWAAETQRELTDSSFISESEMGSLLVAKNVCSKKEVLQCMSLLRAGLCDSLGLSWFAVGRMFMITPPKDKPSLGDDNSDHKETEPRSTRSTAGQN